MPTKNIPKILVVDDKKSNLQVMQHILQKEYQLIFAQEGELAIQLAEEFHPDLILLDVVMPGMDGYEICKQLKKNRATSAIPVIFVTTMTAEHNESLGFDAGAVDYIAKPLKPSIVLRRIQTHLSLVASDELERTRLLLIQRLGRAAEFKDNETGNHVLRMAYSARFIAERLGLPQHWCNLLYSTAPMHDIGKIGIPDKVLLKDGPLSLEEWQIMRQHPIIGAKILGEDESELLEMARTISLTHHEKWDGSGYPYGLKGDEIPLAGRIVAIADVFDALTSKRPYKEAWTVDKATAYIVDQKDQHFDPDLIPIFLLCIPDILNIRETLPDTIDEVSTFEHSNMPNSKTA